MLFLVLVLAEAIEDAAGGKVRAFDEAQQILDRDIVKVVVVVDHVGQAIDDFAQIVGRDVGRHADGNAAGAVDQQIGQRRGQDVRLAQRVVEVVVPVDRILLQIVEHQAADLGQTRLGVAHGRGVVAVDAAKVALPIDQRIAQAEVLGHAHHGVVDRGIAVGVIFAQHFTDDTRALLVRPGVHQIEVVIHGVENAPMDRLEPIAHIRQGARHDHAHGVIEVGVLHGAGDVDGKDGAELAVCCTHLYLSIVGNRCC